MNEKPDWHKRVDFANRNWKIVAIIAALVVLMLVIVPHFTCWHRIIGIILLLFAVASCIGDFIVKRSRITDKSNENSDTFIETIKTHYGIISTIAILILVVFFLWPTVVYWCPELIKQQFQTQSKVTENQAEPVKTPISSEHEPHRETNLPPNKPSLSDSPLAFWGSLASIFALVITVVLTKQLFLQSKQLDEEAKNSRKQMAAEQFKNAIDHLGNINEAVVLGGVYALHNLAENYKEYRQPVFEILCRFIREETRKEGYQAKVRDESVPTDNSQPVTSMIAIQTIVDKLFREKVELDEIDKKTGKKVILYRKYEANLSGAFLCRVDFSNAYLHRVNFIGAKLLMTDFTLAKLQKAELSHAKFHGAILHMTDLSDAVVWKADFRGAQKSKIDYLEKIEMAIKCNGHPLVTDLSGTIVYDAYTKEYFREEGQSNFLVIHSAIVKNLEHADVKEEFKGFKLYSKAAVTA